MSRYFRSPFRESESGWPLQSVHARARAHKIPARESNSFFYYLPPRECPSPLRKTVRQCGCFHRCFLPFQLLSLRYYFDSRAPFNEGTMHLTSERYHSPVANHARRSSRFVATSRDLESRDRRLISREGSLSVRFSTLVALSAEFKYPGLGEWSVMVSGSVFRAITTRDMNRSDTAVTNFACAPIRARTEREDITIFVEPSKIAAHRCNAQRNSTITFLRFAANPDGASSRARANKVPRTQFTVAYVHIRVRCNKEIYISFCGRSRSCSTCRASPPPRTSSLATDSLASLVRKVFREEMDSFNAATFFQTSRKTIDDRNAEFAR